MRQRVYWEGEVLVFQRVVTEGMRILNSSITLITSYFMIQTIDNYELLLSRSLDETNDVKQVICYI